MKRKILTIFIKKINLNWLKISCFLLFLLFNTPVHAQKWLQIGSDVNPTGEIHDISISSDGNTKAVVFRTTDNDVLSVYKFKDNSWIQIGNEITFPNTVNHITVSLSGNGNVVAIGRPQAVINGFDRVGTVDIYNVNLNDLSLISHLDGWYNGVYRNNDGENDYFGTSIELNNIGDKIAIGVGSYYNLHTVDDSVANSGILGYDGSEMRLYNNTINSGFQLSHTFGGYFTHQGNNKYTGTGKYGNLIAFSDDGLTIATSGYIDEADDSQDQHMVRIFRYSSGWNVIGDINLPSYQITHLALNTDGNTLALSNSFVDNSRGETEIYTYNGTGYNLDQTIKGTYANDYLGASIALDATGAKIVLGGKNDNGWSSGQVKIYEKNGGTWNFIQKLTGDSYYNHSPVYYASFGFKVDLSADGTTFIGASANSNEGLIQLEAFRYLSPQIPANFTAENITTISVDLNWDYVIGSSSYILRYRKIGAADWVLLDETESTTVNIDNLYYSTNYEVQIQHLYSETNTSSFSSSLLFTTSTPLLSELTYVPDNNFEQALINEGLDDVLDDYVLTANISSVKSLYLNELNISDLTGIEDFISLTDLSCSDNNLTTLTLPPVTSLANLIVERNNLTTIILPTTLVQILEFGCDDNNITNINFNNVNYINFLALNNNQFTTLDFSNTNVEGLYFANNPLLTSIDLRNGADYTKIYDFYGGNTPLLTCVFVDDVSYANTNWKNSVDSNTTFVDSEAACNFINSYTYVPDTNFEQALINEGLDDVLDDYVLTVNISTIGFLDVSNKNIADLTGIEDFIELETFVCSNNSLTTLDVSTNHFLEFACDNNQLTSLILNTDTRVVDSSNNLLTALSVPIGLANLDCSNNSITSLDLSNTTELSILNCSNNNLEFLDFRNGENGQISSSYDYRTGYDYTFDATNNPDLTCIFVDDADFSTTNWKKVDVTTHFVLNQADCDTASTQTTYVPDDNFEQALIDLGYDSGTLDDYVPTANINTVEVLDISGKDIANLKGIEDFTALLDLNCQQNSLTNLDVTNSNSLIHLNFSFNQLTNIDVSKNTALEILEGEFNQLTSLNVIENINLKRLDCWINKISTIDVSQNTLLEELGLNDNPLVSLDISNNIKLKKVSFGGNDKARSTISSIDVSKNPELTLLNFVYTQITDLNLSNLSVLTTLFVHNNQLTNIDVSKNRFLTDLVCNNNQLEMLNVKNGNNVNFTRFNALNNWRLNCIEVDEPTWSSTNWTDVDNQVTFGGNCHYFETYVPDNNFEQALINLGYDSGTLDDYVLTNTIKSIDSLNVSNKNIADITGLEDFKALTYLNVANNALTDLSLFDNQYLITLICNHNQLTSLELFNNMNLLKIYCNDNQLTRLEYLYYSYDLIYLECSNNQLTDLFIGNNPNLESLYTANNLITYLDVAGNVKLTKLKASQNKLTTLDVRNGNNTNFTEFTAINNSNLTCIYADDVAWSTTNWTNIDATSNFVADETACISLSVDNFDFKRFKILSNPVTEYINLSIEEEVNYILIDINGKILKTGRLSIGYNSINVAEYSKGLYFLKVTNSKKFSTKKILIY